MAQAKKERELIQQSVHVDCPIDDAFRLFTESFSDWWPLDEYSMSGDEAETCAMEPWAGGRVFERTRSGEELDWGSVLEWDPPHALKFTWDPGGAGDRSQTVDVEFSVDADGTRVTVIHSGWDAPGVAICGLPAGKPDLWETLLRRCFAELVSEQMLILV